MNCACHGEPLLWHKDKRKTAGGCWRCAVKHSAARERYEQSDKAQTRKLRYDHTPAGILRNQLYELGRVRLRIS